LLRIDTFICSLCEKSCQFCKNRWANFKFQRSFVYRCPPVKIGPIAPLQDLSFWILRGAQHSPLSFFMVRPKGKFQVSAVVCLSLSSGENWPDSTPSRPIFLNSTYIYDQDWCSQIRILFANFYQFCKNKPFMRNYLKKNESFMEKWCEKLLLHCQHLAALQVTFEVQR